ncbi:hypothetical protein GCM10008955_40060 [Deinococcus malanensis]|uniref:Uncharacterized protein n=1 Tax=Deinococcus malanensis TaxID=1706855 RepID=A0ABQ2F308_9DEIO|nr:hypothetical protein GCM10008955_40060 [Deinococcus malanensis]
MQLQVGDNAVEGEFHEEDVSLVVLDHQHVKLHDSVSLGYVGLECSEGFPHGTIISGADGYDQEGWLSQARAVPGSGNVERTAQCYARAVELCIALLECMRATR